MLSPKARNLVSVRRGGGGTKSTTTANEQLAVRRTASVAAQVTVVNPTGKFEPLDGVHDTDTGWVPSVTLDAP
jgi:hypothetical protein